MSRILMKVSRRKTAARDRRDTVGRNIDATIINERVEGENRTVHLALMKYILMKVSRRILAARGRRGRVGHTLMRPSLMNELKVRADPYILH